METKKKKPICRDITALLLPVSALFLAITCLFLSIEAMGVVAVRSLVVWRVIGVMDLVIGAATALTGLYSPERQMNRDHFIQAMSSIVLGLFISVLLFGEAIHSTALKNRAAPDDTVGATDVVLIARWHSIVSLAAIVLVCNTALFFSWLRRSHERHVATKQGGV